MNIYVGNLPYKLSEDELRAAFGDYGSVSSVAIIKDKTTGLPRGFGFVEMPDSGEAEAAIAAMNGKALMGRTLKVNEARPREEGGMRGDREGFARRDNAGDGFRSR
jgi:RNA recognition motif-containing protein